MEANERADTEPFPSALLVWFHLLRCSFAPATPGSWRSSHYACGTPLLLEVEHVGATSFLMFVYYTVLLFCGNWESGTMGKVNSYVTLKLQVCVVNLGKEAKCDLLWKLSAVGVGGGGGVAGLPSKVILFGFSCICFSHLRLSSSILEVWEKRRVSPETFVFFLLWCSSPCRDPWLPNLSQLSEGIPVIGPLNSNGVSSVMMGTLFSFSIHSVCVKGRKSGETLEGR